MTFWKQTCLPEGTFLSSLTCDYNKKEYACIKGVDGFYMFVNTGICLQKIGDLANF